MNKRKVTVKLIQDERINNHRLVEFFANKFKERGAKDV